MSKKIFSGVQPTGNLHLGNYLGAIKNFVELNNQKDNECIFCVVDLHAITTKQEPKELKKNIRETAATFIASGIDPKKSIIFNQSMVPAHSEGAWILGCVSRIIFSSIIMGLFFNFLINFFENDLAYEQTFKSVHIIGIVLLGLFSYVLIAILIKAFKISDINLKY